MPMSLLTRLLAFITLASISLFLLPDAARADVVCTATQQEVQYYLDDETQSCRTSGSHPASGAMVRMESGPDYVMIDTTYAAGLGPREPSDLHCLEGACGVGRVDETGEAGELGEIIACEGDCRAGFSYRDEYDNSKYVELDFTQSSQTLVATLSGRSGPPEMGEMTVDVPASMGPQRGPFEVSFDFSELAARSDGEPDSEGLPLVINGGVLDRTQVFGSTWRVRVVPTQEGTVSLLLRQSAMVGALTGNPLDTEYRVMVPVDMTPPPVELVYEGPGETSLTEIFRFRSSDRTALVQGTPNVTISGLDGQVEVNPDEEIAIVTVSNPGQASIRLEAGAFADAAGNTSPASAPLAHEFGNRTVDVTNLVASPTVVPFGSTVELTADLSLSTSEGGVSFYVNGDRIGTGSVNAGRSIYETVLYTPGQVEITARFDPATAPRLEAGASAAVTVEVVKGQTGLAITSAPTSGSVSGELSIAGQVSEDYTGSITMEAAHNGDPFVRAPAQIERSGEVLTATFTPEISGTYRLRLVAAETTYFDPAISNEVEVAVNGESASGTLSLDQSSYSIGDRPEILATLTPSDAVGQVAFYHEGVEIGRAAISQGEARVTAPEIEAAGTVRYSASYLPNPPFTAFDFAPVEASVARSDARGTLSSDKQEYAHGERAMLTATVLPETATGSVEFSVAGEVIATAPLVRGIANAQTEPFSQNGFVDLTARYLGDSSFAPFDFDPVRIEVSTSATSLGLEASTTTPEAGASLRLTARIAPRDATGEIVFLVGVDELGRAQLVSGVAEITHAFEEAGELVLTARYAGNGAYAPAEAPEIVVNVRKKRPSGSFGVSTQRAEIGQEITMNVVFSTEGVTGDVEFFADGSRLGTTALNMGAADMRWTPEAAGMARLEARFLGDAAFEAVDFDPIDVEIFRRTTQGSVSLEQGSYTVGERAWAEARMSPVSATGIVRFAVDGISVGTANLNNGVARLELPAWDRSGTRTVSASYEGDADHESSALTPQDVQVEKASVFLSFEALGGPFEVGDTATLALEITPASASGTVTFSVDGQEIGTVSPTAGRAEIQTPSFERAGDILLDARFNGDDGYEAASATPIYVEVARRSAALGLELEGAQAAGLKVDDEATLLARLAEPGSGGTLRLLRDGVEVTNAVLNGTEVRFAVDTSQSGSFSYQAVYEGDGSLGPAQSGRVNVEIARHQPSVEMRISPSQPEAGTTAQMRAILAEHVDGMVSFENDGRSVGASLVVAGEAVAPLTVSEGDYRLVAHFTPDDARAFESAASSPLVFSVGKRPIELSWITQSPEARVDEMVLLEGEVSDPDYTGVINLMREDAQGQPGLAEQSTVSGGRFSFETSMSTAGDFRFWAEVPSSADWASASSDALILRVSALDITGMLEIVPPRVELDDLAIARMTLADPEATGEAVFVDDGVSIGTATVVNGVAEMPLASDRVGTRQIEVRYEGSDRLDPWSSPAVAFEVTRQEGRFQVEVERTEVVVGETVRVSLRALDHATLSGSATFLSNGSVIGSAGMQDGVAIFDAAFEEAGTFTLGGRFEGNGRVAAADADTAVTVEVRQTASSLTLTSSDSESVVDEPLEFVARIEPSAAAGIVRFTGNGEVLTEIDLEQGEARLVHAPQRSGVLRVEASYLGGGAYAAVDASPVSVWIEKAQIEARLSSDAARYERGSSALLTLVLSSSDASGMAEFFRDGASIGMATISAGSVSIGVPLEEVGSVSFTALYLGDDRYASTNTAEALVVEVEDTQSGRVTFDPLPPEVFVGDGIELSGQAEMPQGETGTGEVVLEVDRGEGFIDLMRVPHDAGTWAAGTSFDTEGDLVIRARLDGAGPDGAALYSSERGVNIVRRATGLSLRASPGQIEPGQEVVLTADIAPSSATGDVIFYVDDEEAGRKALTQGAVDFAIDLAAEGTRSLRAEYVGSNAHLGSTSPEASVVVGRPDTEIAITGAFEARGAETLLALDLQMTPDVDGAMVEIVVGYEDEAGSDREQRFLVAMNGGQASPELVMNARPAGERPVQVEAIFEETDTHLGSRAQTTIITPDWDRLEPTRGVVVISPDRAAPGELVSMSLTIAPASATGQVTFSTQDGQLGTAMLTEGRAIVETRFDAAGRYAVSVSYEGDAGHEPWASAEPWIVEIADDKEATRAVLRSDQESYDVGDRATLLFEVSPNSATGNVVFEAEGRGVIATVPLALGQAEASLDLTEEGHLEITARYEGDDQFFSSTASLRLSTGRADTSGSLMSSAIEIVRGEQAVLSVDIYPGEATGRVNFITASGVIGSAELADGRAILETRFDVAGRYEISAEYEGDETYAAWRAAQPVIINVSEQFATTGRLQSDRTAYAVGETAQLRFTVEPSSATGEVVFEREDGSVLATAMLASGEAIAEVEMSEAGHHVFTARYEGDDRHAGSNAQITVSAGREEVSGTLWVSHEEVAAGDMVEMRLSITPADATGEVVFRTQAGTIGSAMLDGGEALFGTTFEALGQHEIFAQYGGDDTFAAWSADEPRVIEVIEPMIATTARLNADASAYAVGDTATLTFELSSRAASGEVVFEAEGQGVFATVPIDAGRAEASFEISAEGHYSLRAHYAGDAQHLGSSAELMISAGRTAVEGQMTLDKAQYEIGETAILRVEMMPTDVAGDLVLRVDGTETMRQTMSAGIAEFAIEVAEEAVALQVVYEGSDLHAAWMSDEIGLRAGAREVEMQLEALTPRAAPGQAVSFRLSFMPVPASGAAEIEANGELAQTLRLSGQSEYHFDLTMPDDGDMEVQALFDGGDGYPASASSQVLVERAERASSEIALRLSDEAPRDGDTITLTGEVSPNTATGEVVFEVNGSEVARAPLSSGRADAIWTVGAGEQSIVARYLGDAGHEAAASAPVVLSVRPLALDLFEERRAFIEDVMAAETERANSARARGIERRMEGVRDRLRNETLQGVPRAEEVSRAGWSNGAWEPFSYQGDIRATDGFAHGDGVFSTRRRLGGTGLEQFVDGGFEVTRRSDLGTSFEGAVNTGVEKRLSEDAIVGASVGLEMAQTSIDSEMSGEMKTLGVNAGVYGAKRLAGDVVVDGYANVARTQHDLDLADDELTAATSYGATTVQIGGSVSGRYEVGRTEFLPAVTLRHSMTARDRASVDLEARTGPATGEIESRVSHETRVEIVPEMRFHSRRENGPVLSVKPKVICEHEEGTECGVGLGAGVEVPVAQGRGKLKAEVSVEQVGDEVEEKIFFGFEIKF